MIRIGIFYFLLVACMSARCAEIHNGQTKAEVLNALGKPSGVVKMNGREYLSYGEFLVEFSSGVVVNLPSGFNQNLQASRLKKNVRDQFIEKQKSKGLVFYDGEWVTEDRKAELVALAEQQAQMRRAKKVAEQERIKREKQVQEWLKLRNSNGPSREYIVSRKNGTKVDHRPLAIPGKVAFVVITKNREFCPMIWKKLSRFIRSDPMIELRRIDISSWDDPLAEQFAIYETPRVRIVDSAGRVLNGPGHSFNVEKLGEAVAQAKQQCGL